jgi:hypothetical protein
MTRMGSTNTMKTRYSTNISPSTTFTVAIQCRVRQNDEILWGCGVTARNKLLVWFVFHLRVSGVRRDCAYLWRITVFISGNPRSLICIVMAKISDETTEYGRYLWQVLAAVDVLPRSVQTCVTKKPRSVSHLTHGFPTSWPVQTRRLPRLVLCLTRRCCRKGEMTPFVDEGC